MKFVTMIPIKFTNKELNFGNTFIPKNEDAIKGLLAEGKVKPLRDIMAEKYNELAEWLHNHDLIGEEIKEAMPDVYEAIQRAIEDMDNAFLIEDLTAFQDALDRVKRLYSGCYGCPKRWEAILPHLQQDSGVLPMGCC